MPTPRQAIVHGHLTVSLPVALVIVTGGVLGHFALGAVWLGILLSAVVAWPLWSYLVPRWRDWVQDAGISPDDVHDMAVRTGLIWPRESVLEKTEFKRRNGKVGW